MADLLQGEKTGLKAAAAATVRPDAPVPGSSAGVEQLPLLPLCLDGDAAPRAEPVPADRGAGRPKGSINKNTAEWREYLLGRFASPLIGLATVATSSLKELATELNEVCGVAKGQAVTMETALVLFKVRQDARATLAPYLHQKQPLAIEGGEHGLITLVMHGTDAAPKKPAEDGVLSVDFIDITPQQNQSLSADKAGNSVVHGSVVSSQVSERTEQNNALKPD